MARIHVLPEEVSSRIAAGEVIERPASTLKELLENSLDAGATRISVEVKGAGKKLLRVSDDGHGMEPKDCELCLGRHATSKIFRLEDISRLDTFGFRGEALFSVAAVSRLSIASCAPDAKTGWKVEAEGGKILSSAPAAAAAGTTVEVKDLFYNTPARLKFLKSDAFEKGRLSGIMEEAALANPHVHFSLKSEGRTVLRFEPEPGADAARKAEHRLVSVFGDDLAQNLLSVAGDRPGFKIRMFVSPTNGLVATRNFQHWFVNHRPISARILQQALYRAYGNYRSKDRHPVCVAHLELPADSFDVNVHPGKREIRFKSDREMFELICGLVSNALFKTHVPRAAPTAGRGLHPASGASIFSESPPLYQSTEPFLKLQASPSQAMASEAPSPRWFTPPYRYLGQIERSYLVFEAAGGLFVLDQHAAAERILFEKFLGDLESGRLKSQKLLLPVSIDLPASAAQKVLSQKRRLERLGFELAPFGKTALHVLAVPALFNKAGELNELAHRLIETLENPAGAAQDARRDAVATIACKAAVKAHDALSEKEALRLLEDLKDCRDGSACPHGRRSIMALNREELARRFQRPGAPPL
ncbi:MAG: hypothetical protein A3J74_04015 [Elusimicrobia bacterium RIFCSPHIGHO2_02_FULL_57_9]|nr:MAG: hypothetical protein A3J74_04015 [Elusimicrobia bacterium RIFCSPHIGHO2_02_FULL_57_9]